MITLRELRFIRVFLIIGLMCLLGDLAYELFII